jgi:hypothetical protein
VRGASKHRAGQKQPSRHLHCLVKYGCRDGLPPRVIWGGQARPGDDLVKSGDEGGEEGVLFRVLPRVGRNGTILTSAIPSGRGAADAAAAFEGGQSLAKTLVVDGHQGPKLGPSKRSVTTVEGLQDAFLQGRLPS